jgi:hypothetical protein
MLSHLKNSVEEKSVETSNTGIGQCIKAHLVNLQSRFSKYFSEAISNKYKRITDPFHADSSPNYDSFLEEEQHYIDIISDTSLKDQFPTKIHRILGGHWRGVPSPQQKSRNILLPFTTSYLCEAGSSAVRAIKTKCPSIMHLEIPLQQPFQNSNLSMIRYVQRGKHICPTNPGMKCIFYFSALN